MQKSDVNGQRSTSSRGVTAGNRRPTRYLKAVELSAWSYAVHDKTPDTIPDKLLKKTSVLIVHHAPLIRVGLAGVIDAGDRFGVCGNRRCAKGAGNVCEISAAAGPAWIDAPSRERRRVNQGFPQAK